MRARDIMPGQPYVTPDGIVTVAEVDIRGGAVRAADGRSWPCRSIRPTPPQKPGSRQISRPFDVTCTTCDAAPGDGCTTAAGNPCRPHEPRWQYGVVGIDPARFPTSTGTTAWSAATLTGATR